MIDDLDHEHGYGWGKRLIWGVLLLAFLFMKWTFCCEKGKSQVQGGDITLSLAIKDSGRSPQLFVPQLLTRPFVPQLFPPIPIFYSHYNFLLQSSFFFTSFKCFTPILCFYSHPNFPPIPVFLPFHNWYCKCRYTTTYSYLCIYSFKFRTKSCNVDKFWYSFL